MFKHILIPTDGSAVAGKAPHNCVNHAAKWRASWWADS